MSEEKHEDDDGTDGDMVRLGSITPDVVRAVMMSLPEMLSVEDVVEIVGNIMMNYNMLEEADHMAFLISMMGKEGGISPVRINQKTGTH